MIRFKEILMAVCRTANFGATTPTYVSWILAAILTVVFFHMLRAPSVPDEKVIPTVPSQHSAPKSAQTNTPPVLSDMKIQPGPCEGFPGTIQVIANVCDDGNGSFFVRLNPNDSPGTRVAHLMERVRSYKLDFLNRRILSITPITDTLCFNSACAPIMYGAYGRYEFLK